MLQRKTAAYLGNSTNYRKCNMTVKNIGQICRELIQLHPDWTAEQVIAEMKKTHPDAETKAASIAWYKSDMKKRNIQVAQLKERTLEVIEADLAAAKDKVAMIEAELEEFKNKAKIAKFNAAIKVLMDCGMSEEEAMELLKKKEELANS